MGRIACGDRDQPPAGRLAIRLGAFMRRHEGDGCPATETGESIELRMVLVRFAAQHRNPAERTMLNSRSWLRGPGSGLHGRLLGQPARLQVGPVERCGE
jgi:hypothetical protein